MEKKKYGVAGSLALSTVLAQSKVFVVDEPTRPLHEDWSEKYVVKKKAKYPDEKINVPPGYRNPPKPLSKKQKKKLNNRR